MIIADLFTTIERLFKDTGLADLVTLTQAGRISENYHAIYLVGLTSPFKETVDENGLEFRHSYEGHYKKHSDFHSVPEWKLKIAYRPSVRIIEVEFIFYELKHVSDEDLKEVFTRLKTESVVVQPVAKEWSLNTYSEDNP